MANVSYYEEWVDSGKEIKRSHEAFLQSCINNDFAMKNENALKNDLTAKFIKFEYNLNEMEILKTSIKIKKS